MALEEYAFSLSNGRLVVQVPMPLSAEEVQEVKELLALVERSITRRAALAGSGSEALKPPAKAPSEPVDERGAGGKG